MEGGEEKRKRKIKIKIKTNKQIFCARSQNVTAYSAQQNKGF